MSRSHCDPHASSRRDDGDGDDDDDDEDDDCDDDDDDDEEEDDDDECADLRTACKSHLPLCAKNQFGLQR